MPVLALKLAQQGRPSTCSCQSSCTKTCPTNFTLDADSCSCKCNKTCSQGESLDLTTCTCKQNTCSNSCSPGFTLGSYPGCACTCTKTCPTGQTLDQGSCSCKSDCKTYETLFLWRCYVKPSGSSYQYERRLASLGPAGIDLPGRSTACSNSNIKISGFQVSTSATLGSSGSLKRPVCKIKAECTLQCERTGSTGQRYKYTKWPATKMSTHTHAAYYCPTIPPGKTASNMCPYGYKYDEVEIDLIPECVGHCQQP